MNTSDIEVANILTQYLRREKERVETISGSRNMPAQTSGSRNIRKDLVKSLKDAIAESRYSIPGEDVARMILVNSFTDMVE